MQFRDLGAQYQVLKTDIDNAIERVLKSGRYIGGTEVSALEEELAGYVDTKYCITCGNGTDALQLALMAWNIGPGDAVIVPDFTFFSSGEVVSAVGATPIFVDVLESTFNLDPAQIEPAVKLAQDAGLTPKVVVAVDLFGQPADYAVIKKECERYNLLLLEDGAQGFGGSINSQMACSFGDIATTSFFPAKPLGCYGDGGAIFTNNDEWAELILSYAIHGKGSMKYDNVRIGMNSRLDTIQAAILRVKLRAFQEYEVEAVNERAYWYNEALSDTSLMLPKVVDGMVSSWAQYTVQLPESFDRDRLQSNLKEADIPTMVYYPKPMHEQEAFEGNSLIATEGYPTSVRFCSSVLSLPISPYLSRNDAYYVAATIKGYLQN